MVLFPHPPTETELLSLHNDSSSDHEGNVASYYQLIAPIDVLVEDNPPPDPTTLCPWCDDPLPANPSEELQALMEAARDLSVAQPTKWNPLAMSGSVAVISAVCHRHERELDQELDPLAYNPTLRGWPEIIDWKAIPHRVISMKDSLQRIADDVDEEWQRSPLSKRHVKSLEEDSALLTTHPRTESFFWKAITNEIIVNGLRYVKDLDGQTEIYKRTKPG